MEKYIATFYSHFGALTYCKALTKQGINAKLMPVPRKISSSCGTCVSYGHDSAVEMEDGELEAIYIEKNNDMECLLRK